eukprot:scaffold1634_cov137-Amphora_coffeaeformis.AAC.6
MPTDLKARQEITQPVFSIPVCIILLVNCTASGSVRRTSFLPGWRFLSPLLYLHQWRGGYDEKGVAMFQYP